MSYEKIILAEIIAHESDRAVIDEQLQFLRRLLKKGRATSVTEPAPVHNVADEATTEKSRPPLKNHSRGSAPTPIDQYTIEGEYLQTHESINAASRATGVAASGIGKSSRGDFCTAGGYRWAKEGIPLPEAKNTRINVRISA